MANSFGDQFLKAGLVNKTQLDKAQKSKRKQQHQKTLQKNRRKIEVEDEATLAARQAEANKAEHDRELNRRRKEALERKAAQAQVRQLIEMNRVSLDAGEVAYHFQDGTAIKQLFVPQSVRDKLGRDLLAIARFDDHYQVIPAEVAEKIKLRDPSCLVGRASGQSQNGDEDPYADYRVPDDLIW